MSAFLDPLRGLGTALTPAVIEGTYAALTRHRMRLDPVTTRADVDLAYGAHRRNRLDLYRPLGRELPEVVLLYVHGGGFAAGDKGGPGAPFFANIGAWAVAQGLIGAAMSYRLVPEARWPSGAEDIAAAVDFLASGAGYLLPDTPQLVLVGQSAGAIHVADYLAGRGGPVHRALRGAVLMSGIYDFSRHDRLTFEDGYFGADPAGFAAQSTLMALADCDRPLMFTVSELDPPAFQRQAALVVEDGLARRGVWPRMHWLAGHNHLSPALFLGAEGDRVGPEITAFARICAEAGPAA